MNTTYIPITKNTTSFIGDDDHDSILLDDDTATLDSLDYYLHGYSIVYPPNQNSTKDSNTFTSISKPLTNYS